MLTRQFEFLTYWAVVREPVDNLEEVEIIRGEGCGLGEGGGGDSYESGQRRRSRSRILRSRLKG